MVAVLFCFVFCVLFCVWWVVLFWFWCRCLVGCVCGWLVWWVVWVVGCLMGGGLGGKRSEGGRTIKERAIAPPREKDTEKILTLVLLLELARDVALDEGGLACCCRLGGEENRGGVSAKRARERESKASEGGGGGGSEPPRETRESAPAVPRRADSFLERGKPPWPPLSRAKNAIGGTLRRAPHPAGASWASQGPGAGGRPIKGLKGGGASGALFFFSSCPPSLSLFPRKGTRANQRRTRAAVAHENQLEAWALEVRALPVMFCREWWRVFFGRVLHRSRDNGGGGKRREGEREKASVSFSAQGNEGRLLVDPRLAGPTRGSNAARGSPAALLPTRERTPGAPCLLSFFFFFLRGGWWVVGGGWWWVWPPLCVWGAVVGWVVCVACSAGEGAWS